MEASHALLAGIWKVRAEKARALAGRLSEREAAGARLYAAECEYRANCLSEIHLPSGQCDICPFRAYGRCA